MITVNPTIDGRRFCRCCGEGAPVSFRGPTFKARCERHAKRNPCAVEGCRRTRSTSGYLSSEVYLCGEHYRLAAPPGSAYRRVLLRLWRLARKSGVTDGGNWPHDLNARYWRVWAAIVARARSLATGDVDMTEINKLFGWKDEN